MKIPPAYSTQETIDLTRTFCEMAIAKEVEGDFVECGVAAGNSLATMCQTGRHGYGFDSFQGIPWAGEFDDIQPGMSSKVKGEGESSGVTVHSLEDVIANMKMWGIENYTLIKGWFRDTIPNQTEVKKIAVLRLDGDLYDSTMIPLIYLYPHLTKGGYLIIDDWELKGCRKAFTDFFDALGEYPEMILDNKVTYWRK